MNGRDPYRIPSANALIAFESAARHGNFTLAARELRTSQSAVSRQIGTLETWLSARLFQRSRAGATLTDAGERFRDGVAAGLAAIHRGAAEAAELSNAEQVVIALEMASRKGTFWPREKGPPWNCEYRRDVAGRSVATGGQVAASAIAVAPPVSRGTPGYVWRP